MNYWSFYMLSGTYLTSKTVLASIKINMQVYDKSKVKTQLRPKMNTEMHNNRRSTTFFCFIEQWLAF